MNIQIRVSTSDDVYQIREVQKNTWIDTYPNEENGISKKDVEEVFQIDITPTGQMKMEERKKRYQNPNLRTWVATDDDQIVGFCSAGKESDKNRIHAIYLLPSYQGKGIGRLLLESAFAWLGKEKDIYVNVVQYNDKAIGFYKKMGFLETGKTGIFDTVSILPSGKDLPEMELIIKK